LLPEFNVDGVIYFKREKLTLVITMDFLTLTFRLSVDFVSHVMY